MRGGWKGCGVVGMWDDANAAAVLGASLPCPQAPAFPLRALHGRVPLFPPWPPSPSWLQVVWEDEAARAAAREALAPARPQHHRRSSQGGGSSHHSASGSQYPVPPYAGSGRGSAAPSEAGNNEISADIGPASVLSGWSGRSAATVQPVPRRLTGGGYAGSQAGSHAGSQAGSHGEHPATEQLRRSAARLHPGSPRSSAARAGRPFATKVRGVAWAWLVPAHSSSRGAAMLASICTGGGRAASCMKPTIVCPISIFAGAGRPGTHVFCPHRGSAGAGCSARAPPAHRRLGGSRRPHPRF